MNYRYDVNKLTNYLSENSLKTSLLISNLQNLLFSLSSTNLQSTCNILAKSIFLRDSNYIIRLVDNIFICTKYREFNVNLYSSLLFGLSQILEMASQIKISIESGKITENAIKSEQFYKQFDNQKESNCTHSILIEGIQQPEETDKSEFYFQLFIKNSSKNLEIFINRTFTINQSIARQPWRLFCIQRCLNIFNEEVYHFISNFFDKSITIEVEQMQVFCYFAPFILKNSPKIYERVMTEMSYRMSHNRLPYSFKNFIDKLDELKANNWEIFNSYVSNCGFTTTSPMYAIRQDDVSYFTQKKTTQIEDIIDNNSRVLENCFIRYPQLNHRCTLLQLAAYYGSVKCFDYLLEHGADPKLEDEIGLNLMQYAVIGANRSIILKVQQLDFKFDIGSISLIAESYHNSFFYWLLEQVHVNLEESQLQTGTILHRACSGNNIDIILFCIASEININVFDNLNLTPLFYAASNCSIDAINLLLGHKDINWSLSDKFGDTPLHGAAKSADCDTFEAVLNHKDADINVKDFRSKSPFSYAIGEGKYDIVQMILDKHFDSINFEETGISGEPLIFKPLGSHYLNTFIIVCKYPQFNVNEPRKDGSYLIHAIVQSCQIEFASHFLKLERADPNVRLPDGTTALHIAAQRGFDDFVKLFLNNPKTDGNLKNGYGSTALHLAVNHNHASTVKILCECDCIDLKLTHNGLTPFDLANLLGLDEIINILKKYQS